MRTAMIGLVLAGVVAAATGCRKADRKPEQPPTPMSSPVQEAGPSGWIDVRCSLTVVSKNEIELRFENTSSKRRSFLLGAGMPPYVVIRTKPLVLHAYPVCPFEYLHVCLPAEPVSLAPGEVRTVRHSWRVPAALEELIGRGPQSCTYRTLRDRDEKLIPLFGATRPTASRYGETVNGLRLSLTPDKDTWDANGDITFTIELENVGDETRVVPEEFCENVHWPAIVHVHFKTPTGQVLRFLAGSVVDPEYEHWHELLALPGKRRLLHQTTLEWLLYGGLYGGGEQSVRKTLGDGGYFLVWAELNVVPQTLEHYFPADAWLGPLWDRHRSAEDPRKGAKPEDFKSRWPSWAWKGKLKSNTVRVTVRAKRPEE